ncbi:MAG: MFS transporter [Candidatus Lokiarchaeota archaeon]|nr:MFS transporter [Candidatus Lokiarchaeota archaeon]MBD3202028.1 MFS transporter [Candidatus Lokiarchaeota archaeon]
MEKSNKTQPNKPTKKETIFYSFAGIADTMSYQMFSFYIFNYYLAVKEVPILWLTIGFIIWTIWNAINDPLLGAISDKTVSKFGRRRPFIIGGLVPLIALIILVWTPFGDTISIFIYFLIIINLFDTFYTMYSLNQTSLFPEMFQNLEDRAKANNYVQIFNIIGLLLAAILPTLFVGESLAPGTESGFILGALIMAVITIIFGFLFVKFGIKERVEYSKDPIQAPSFLDSVKFTFGNKPFRTYVLTNLAVWYVFGLVPIISPFFLKFIIGVTDATTQSLFLALLFIVSILFMIPWSKVFNKKGPRKAELIALLSLIIVMFPFLIVWEIIGAILAYVIAGIGFAGIMFGRDMMMSTIIDSDELKTGIRREAAYYGVNALIIRLSTIGVYLSIFFVFSNIGWEEIIDPSKITGITEIGIRLLMFVIPAIILFFGFLSLFRFPITKEKYDQQQIELDKLHDEKMKKSEIQKYEEII